MPESAGAQECEIADCLRPAHSRGRFCSAHAKQNQRGGITHAPIRERMPLQERVGHLCDELANADADDDRAYNKAWDALRKALMEWTQALRQQRAGRARMEGMSPEERSLLGRRAVKARSRKVARQRRIAIATKAANARAEALDPGERSAIARKAASARWDACLPTRLESKHALEEQAIEPTPGGKRRAAEGD